MASVGIREVRKAYGQVEVIHGVSVDVNRVAGGDVWGSRDRPAVRRVDRERNTMRVLSTESAKTAIVQVQAIVNDGLVDEINKLDQQGRTLSNPDVWDGPLASSSATQK